MYILQSKTKVFILTTIYITRFGQYHHLQACMYINMMCVCPCIIAYA